ncbi:MAG: hypothetical protein H5T78_04740 [Nocardia sp.]|nr:hypothetical protein [Nocardia sp.]
MSVVVAVVISLGYGMAGVASAAAGAGVILEPVVADMGSATPFTASADPQSGSAAIPRVLLECLSSGSSLSMGMPLCG